MAFKLNTPPVGGTIVGDFQDSSQYVAVAASATTQQVSVSGHAGGDYLERVIINQLTTAAGAVSIFDGTTAVVSCPAAVATGTYFVPFSVECQLTAQTTKGFNVTTGANVTVTLVGRFGGAAG